MTFSFKLITFWLNQDSYTPQGFILGLELGGRSRDSGKLPISLASPSLVGWLDQQLLGGNIIFTGMVVKGVAASSRCLLPSWGGGNRRILCLSPMDGIKLSRLAPGGEATVPVPDFGCPGGECAQAGDMSPTRSLP